MPSDTFPTPPPTLPSVRGVDLSIPPDPEPRTTRQELMTAYDAIEAAEASLTVAKAAVRVALGRTR